jgi:hypothetical protein
MPKPQIYIDKLAIYKDDLTLQVVRVHKAHSDVTPAMEAGIADHAWSIEQLIALLDCSEKRLA